MSDLFNGRSWYSKRGRVGAWKNFDRDALSESDNHEASSYGVVMKDKANFGNVLSSPRGCRE